MPKVEIRIARDINRKPVIEEATVSNSGIMEPVEKVVEASRVVLEAMEESKGGKG